MDSIYQLLSEMLNIGISLIIAFLFWLKKRDDKKLTLFFIVFFLFYQAVFFFNAETSISKFIISLLFLALSLKLSINELKRFKEKARKEKIKSFRRSHNKYSIRRKKKP